MEATIEIQKVNKKENSITKKKKLQKFQQSKKTIEDNKI